MVIPSPELFDGWAQFFASRGISVLQPDFRGSTGLGYSHYMLGNKQWGKTMQDDLSDGVKWAIDNGYADADRVCIAGASYGGYATMAGMTFTPELYRCGINGVGVTDQMLILENFAQKRSRNQSWDKEPLLEWGDLYNEEDYAYAKASSPVNFSIKNRLITTTLISVPISALVIFIILSGFITLDMFDFYNLIEK